MKAASQEYFWFFKQYVFGETGAVFSSQSIDSCNLGVCYPCFASGVSRLLEGKAHASS